MADDFDPYYKWLGVPPAEQPPNHYRLLGVQLFEPDLEVIEAAADRHVAYLQDVATGPHVRESQRLLNEIAAARLCLSDQQRRATYDAQLRQRSTPPPAAAAAPPVSPPVDVKPSHPHPLAPPPPVGDRSRRLSATRAEARIPFPWIVGGGTTGLVIVALILILGIGRSPSKAPPATADRGDGAAVTRPVPQSTVTESARLPVLPSAVESAGGIEPLGLDSAAPTANAAGKLVAHYTFEHSAQPGRDETGRHTASAAGAILEPDADRGSRVLVLGVDGRHIDIPRPVEDDFTIALWIKTGQEGRGGAYWHMGVGIVDGDVEGPAHDFGLSLMKGKAAFGVGTQGTTIKSHRDVNDDRWHHVAVTRQSSTGRMKLYLDGELEADEIGPAGPKDVPPRLAVGRSSNSTRRFEGRLDDLRIYDGLLAQSQIRGLMAAATE